MSLRAALVLALLCASGCHAVSVSPASFALTPAAPLGAHGRVEVDRASAARVVRYRDGRLGLATTFSVRVGAALAAGANALLAPALEAPEDARGALVVHLSLGAARFEDFGARFEFVCEAKREGELVLERRYEIEGPRYRGVGGESPERAAIVALERTTRDAVVLGLREIEADLRAAEASSRAPEER